MISEPISAIENRLTVLLKATPPFDAINMSPSNVAIWSNFLNTIATEIFTLEQLNNVFQTEIEATVAKAIPATAVWIKDEIMKFQYPDVAQINPDFTVSYNAINAVLQIITAAAVIPSSSGLINIKAAKGSPRVPLSAPELTALKAYCEIFLPAGALTNIISVDADTLQINAEVFYNGQYAANIQADVIAALTAYMASLPFNGVVKNSDIETVILGVAGVTDVVLQQVTATPFGGSPIDLILGSLEQLRSYQTYSGSINNAAAPFDLATTLTFTISNS
jgi:hypothetical protein